MAPEMNLPPMIFAAIFLLSYTAHAQSSLPSFSATTLTGQVVTEEKLIGQPTVLIVTPSKVGFSVFLFL
jgi:hypothetical protein